MRGTTTLNFLIGILIGLAILGTLTLIGCKFGKIFLHKYVCNTEMLSSQLEIISNDINNLTTGDFLQEFVSLPKGCILFVKKSDYRGNLSLPPEYFLLDAICACKFSKEDNQIKCDEKDIVCHEVNLEKVNQIKYSNNLEYFQGKKNTIEICIHLDMGNNLEVLEGSCENYGLSYKSVYSEEPLQEGEITKFVPGEWKSYEVTLEDGSNIKLRYNEDIDKFITNAYQKLDTEIPLNFVRAIAMAETGFGDPRWSVSWAGAVGIMQLMPKTARDFGLRVPDYSVVTCYIGNRAYSVPACNSCKVNGKKLYLKECKSKFEDERFDPEKNILAGIKYLDMLYDVYANKDLALTAAAYNGGPRCLSLSSVCPGKMWWNCEKNKGYEETRKYVEKVMKYYNTYEILEKEGKIGMAVG